MQVLKLLGKESLKKNYKIMTLFKKGAGVSVKLKVLIK